MRRLLVMLAVLALVPAARAHADTISVGQIISPGPGMRGNTNGGEYLVYGANHSEPALFGTFCIETDRYLNFNDSFMVGSINTAALNDQHPLHDGTAYLYAQWRSGVIAQTYATATDLQNAIWYFEGEGGVANRLYTTTHDLAGIGNATDNLGDVRVINLLGKDRTGAYKVDAQDLLVLREPGTPSSPNLARWCCSARG